MDMLKELGQIATLLRQAPKIKEEMERLQARLGQITAEGDAGGGLVKVRVNGRMEITACVISDDAMKMNDRELLEDLIKSAANQAMDRARRQVGEETGKMASSFGLPGMPDIQGMMSGNNMPVIDQNDD
jgi:DNA-binding YbaB/EbfC family protein